jgi:hypothetical protein
MEAKDLSLTDFGRYVTTIPMNTKAVNARHMEDHMAAKPPFSRTCSDVNWLSFLSF